MALQSAPALPRSAQGNPRAVSLHREYAILRTAQLLRPLSGAEVARLAVLQRNVDNGSLL